MTARDPDRLKFDMHVHSCHSSDSAVPVASILRAWRRHGVLSLVCDHNSIRGSAEVCAGLKRIDPDAPRILAEEIMTAEGEIIGAFLSEEIPPHLSAHETLDRIRDQGAIAIVPHPFCTFRSSTIHRATLLEAAGRVDAIEGKNARNITPDVNLMAERFARCRGLPQSAGSDAHTPFELARTYVLVEPFDGPRELLANLREADVRFSRTPPVAHTISRTVRALRTGGIAGRLQTHPRGAAYSETR